MKKRILVIDDDESIHNLLDYVLEKQAYQVLKAISLKQALKILEEHFIDAIILDRMLSDNDDGIHILQHIRSNLKLEKLPVIVLSGKDENEEKIFGLKSGADDYITKPFDKNELLARLEALFRRIDLDREQSDQILEFDHVKVILEQHKIWIGNKEVYLKPKEYDLFVYLIKHPGKVFSREEILEKIWGYKNAVETRTVDVHIQKIRKKLLLTEDKDAYIETVRGYGYRFNIKNEINDN